MKARIKDAHTLEYAPKIVTIEGVDYIPPTNEWLEASGFKEVEATPYPEVEPYIVVEWSYTEKDGKIVKEFTILPDERPAREKREYEYEHRACVEWGNGFITVDEAVKLVYQYEAEGREMSKLKTFIHLAKEAIRSEFPDE